MSKHITFLDGAMGTQLQQAGLKAGECPELLCFSDPELIISIHKKYISAGSDIIYANTFGANRIKLQKSDHSPAEVVEKAISLAKEASGGRAKVALDIGPLGVLFEPLGELDFDTAYDAFAEMLVAGERAGADLVVFETFTELAEVRAGVIAAKELTKLPIYVTMSFEKNGRTFTGCCVASMAVTLSSLGVSALGFNCSLGPCELLPLAEELVKYTDLPLIIKPNAGLPDPVTNAYPLTESEFADGMRRFLKLGMKFAGGCCGTSPEYIRALKESLSGTAPSEPERNICRGFCSASEFVPSDRITVVGERINPTGKRLVKQALLSGDTDSIQAIAIGQQEAGADILDVNVGLPEIDEPLMMKRVVRSLQFVTDLPLQIDSSDPAAIEAGLRYFCGRGVVNSVNGDKEVLDTVLPIAKKYGAAVIGLTMDSLGVPETAEKRLETARRIVNAAEEYGIPKDSIYIDCLTLTVSAQQSQAAETLKAVSLVKNKLGVKTVLGVSNISFGLPERSNITRTFLVSALSAGLDMPIINPNDRSVMDGLCAYRAINGEDVGCERYISRFSSVGIEPQSEILTLSQAIIAGRSESASEMTEAMLKSVSSDEIINLHLIPSLDAVGDSYEKGEVFLPQLLRSANAACAAFESIKKCLRSAEGAQLNRGSIILATVKGDIHDIGKNIVKIILQNYGYEVIDLGKDVPKEKILYEAESRGIRLVGLSALMTTTVPAMEDTVRLLKQKLPLVRVMVGGAVLTEEFAKRIGADYYAADAKAAADIAKEVFK